MPNGGEVSCCGAIHSVPDLRDKKNRSGFSNPLIFSKLSGNHPLIHPIIFSPSGSPSLIFFAFRVQHPLFFWLRELYPLKIFASGCKLWVANSRDPLIPLNGSFMQGYWRWNPPVPAKTQVPEVESLSTCQNTGTGGSTSGTGGGVPQHLPKRWYQRFHLWYQRFGRC